MPCTLRGRPYVYRLVRAVMAVSLLWPVAALAGSSKPASASVKGWQVVLAAPALQDPTGIAIDLRGSRAGSKWAYTADATSGRIVKFGTGGRILHSWSYTAPGEKTVGAAVAVGGTGNVFVADPIAGSVAKYTPTGSLLTRWTGFAHPQSIVVAPSGTIYLAETAMRRVTAVSPAGIVIKHWDTEAGFLQGNTVPPTPSGALGDPTSVALQLPDALFVSTRCAVHVSCNPASAGISRPPMVDALLTLRISGFRAGYLGDWWFGLDYAADGTPKEPPGKESQSFVTIDCLTSNRHQRTYLAGKLWVLGQKPTRGVITYSALGSGTAYWPLPSQSPVAGIAQDNLGRIYVAQNHRILRLDPAKTPGQGTPYGG